MYNNNMKIHKRAVGNYEEWAGKMLKTLRDMTAKRSTIQAAVEVLLAEYRATINWTTTR